MTSSDGVIYLSKMFSRVFASFMESFLINHENLCWQNLAGRKRDIWEWGPPEKLGNVIDL